MPTLHDVYPFTEEELPEFERMLRLPSVQDIAAFADVATRIIETHPTHVTPNLSEGWNRIQTTLWLPEGVIFVDLIKTDHPMLGPDIIDALEVQLVIGSELNNLATAREVIIKECYSDEQQLEWANLQRAAAQGHMRSCQYPISQFIYTPTLTDLGVSTVDEEAATIFDELVALRCDVAPDHVHTQTGTLTEDILVAERVAIGEALLDELDQNGESLGLPSEHDTRLVHAKTTVVSQMTLRALTALLETFTP